MFSSKEKYIKFILYITVLILVNVAGINMFFRIDLTNNKIYSLSQASKEVAATLSEPLSIKVFFSKDLPAPHNNTEQYLKDLLEEYAAKGGQYFNYSFYNVTPDEDAIMQKADENRNMARDYGIEPIQIQILENDEVKFKNAYMGMVIIHGDLIERIGAITSTNGLEYQITAAIQKLNNKISALHRLDNKIDVTMFLSPSLNQIAPLIGLNELPKLGKAISDTIEKINSQSLGVLNFVQNNQADKATLDKLAQEQDLMVLSWPPVPEKNIPEGFGAAGLIIEYKGETKTLPLIQTVEIPIIGTTYQMTNPAALEGELVSIMEKFIGINKEIGILQSHGALPLMNPAQRMPGQPNDALNAFNALISTRYSIKPVDLKKDIIPQGLSCLIIPRPTEKFSDYELFQIDQALMKGTNIAVFSDSFTMAPSPARGMPPMFIPIDSGLDKLLNHYGISIKKGYVLDEQCYKAQVPREMGGGQQDIYFFPLLKNEQINTDPMFMNNIKGLVAAQISPLELLNDKIDPAKVKSTALLESSDRSWLMENNINLNPSMISPPKEDDAFSSYQMSYVLEGSFTSFFKGKTLPEKTDDDEQVDKKPVKENTPSNEAAGKITAKNIILEQGKSAKLFILPSSQMITDGIIDPQGRTMNATFILNAIDHLNNEDQMASLRAKEQTLNPLEETSPSLKAVYKTINIIGLPVIVILFGLGVLAKRTARKKKLTKRFSE